MMLKLQRLQQKAVLDDDYDSGKLDATSFSFALETLLTLGLNISKENQIL